MVVRVCRLKIVEYKILNASVQNIDRIRTQWRSSFYHFLDGKSERELCGHRRPKKAGRALEMCRDNRMNLESDSSV